MIEAAIRDLTAADWPAVRKIYAEGIATGDATFELRPPDWPTWDRAHLSTCRFVMVATGEIVAWAALAPISDRSVYAGVAEVSIYVSASARGRGRGKRLLRHLMTQSERAGLWTLQAGLFPENKASVQLHLSCGFRRVGVRQRLGRQHDRWRDVVLLERRRSE